MEQAQSRAFRAYYLDRELEVLLEEEKEIDGQSYWIGHTKEYVKVAVISDGMNHANRIVCVKAYDFLKNEIIIAH